MAQHARDAHLDSHRQGDHAAHVVPVRTYLLVFAALLVGTWLTVAVAGIDFGVYNTVVALAIALAKAALVILFFMHVKYSGRMTQVIVVASVAWLILLFTTLFDYYAPRMDGGIPRRGTITRQ